MTINAEIYKDALDLLAKLKESRTDERSDKARFRNASQKTLEDFVAYWRVFVLDLNEIEAVVPPESIGLIAPGLNAGVKQAQ